MRGRRSPLITVGSLTIEGNLNLPAGARAVVLFSHGSGSSRHSSRNRHVARVLNEATLATLLIDLLSA
ncbi:MAG: putative phosphoribosyl transferase, partial [Bradyrhizobium sp.]|nr:putative phosphoribosyl transferase [Bradyrhizobium sp.]